MAYPYVPAKYQWSRYHGVSPTLLVLHSMEAPEKGDTAESCANYFRKGIKVASAHLCIDNNSIVQSVPFSKEAAGAKGGPYKGTTVNAYAIHFEHAGYARQSPADWADDFSTQMLLWSSIAAADVCKTYNIPALRLSSFELRQGKSGICTHKDITDAFQVSGGHTDPGPGFPLNSYIANVNYWLGHPAPPDPGEDDMFTDDDRKLIKDLQDKVTYLTHVQDDIIRPKLDAVYVDTHAQDHAELLAGQVSVMSGEVKEILEKITAPPATP